VPAHTGTPVCEFPATTTTTTAPPRRSSTTMTISISYSRKSAALAIIFVPALAAVLTLASAASAAPARPAQRCTFETAPNGALVVTCPKVTSR
jgi:hypothetical protein